jgi:hypothetical protein
MSWWTRINVYVLRCGLQQYIILKQYKWLWALSIVFAFHCIGSLYPYIQLILFLKKNHLHHERCYECPQVTIEPGFYWWNCEISYHTSLFVEVFLYAFMTVKFYIKNNIIFWALNVLPGRCLRLCLQKWSLLCTKKLRKSKVFVAVVWSLCQREHC